MSSPPDEVVHLFQYLAIILGCGWIWSKAQLRQKPLSKDRDAVEAILLLIQLGYDEELAKSRVLGVRLRKPNADLNTLVNESIVR